MKKNLILLTFFFLLISLVLEGFNYNRFLGFHIFNPDKAPMNLVFQDPPDQSLDYMISAFRFDVASGNIIDEAGSITLEAGGSPTYRVEDISDRFDGITYCIDFSGDDYFATSGDVDAWDLDATETWTIYLLVKIDSTASGDQWLLDKNGASGGDWYLKVDSAGNFKFYGTDGTHSWSYNTTGVDFRDDSFHMVQLQSTGTNVMYMWVDELVAYDDNTGAPVGDLDNDGALVVGQTTAGANRLHGCIAGLSISNIDYNTFPYYYQIWPSSGAKENDYFFFYSIARSSSAYGPENISGNRKFRSWSTNELRRVYLDNAYGYAFESEKTNGVLQSQDMSTTWTATNITVNNNQGVGVLGTSTADELVDSDGVNAGYIEQTVTLGNAGNKAVFCVWASGAGETMTLSIDGTTGTHNLTADLARYCTSDAATSADNVVVRIYATDFSVGSDTGTILVDEAEAFIKQDYPNIGIVPTTTAIVTQQDELATISKFDTDKGFSYDYFSMCTFIRRQDDSGNQHNGLLTNSTGAYNFRFYANNSSVSKPNIQTNGFTNGLNSTCDSCSTIVNNWSQLCVFLDQANGKITWYQDGTFVESDTDTFDSMDSSLDEYLKIGGLGTNYRMLDGALAHYHQFKSKHGMEAINISGSLALSHWSRYCGEMGACP